MSLYAISDLHGRDDLFQKVDEFIKKDKNNICYVLGDNIDRAPGGINIIKHILNDSQYFPIFGNHEQMMVYSVPMLIRNERTGYTQSWLDDNGGELTWGVFDCMEEKEIMEIIDEVKQWSWQEKIRVNENEFIYLDHAGFTPLQCWRSEEPLWDRRHFDERWTGDPNYRKRCVVHGHTPVQYMKFHYDYKDRDFREKIAIKEAAAQEYEKTGTIQYTPEVLFYCHGADADYAHKIDIDMGSVTSGRVAVLNLETKEVTYIDGDKEYNYVD